MNIETEAHVVVGIGVSDDGVGAFGRVLDELGTLPRLSIVCVHNFNQVSPSKWLEDLVARSSLNIAVPQNESPLEPGLVYVCPPNQRVQIRGGSVLIEPLPEEDGDSNVFDTFLHSLAEDQGKFAVGIELSGKGTLSKIGLQSILAHGGMAFTRDSVSGQLDSMQILSSESEASRAIKTTDVAIEIRRLALEIAQAESFLDSKMSLLNQIESAIPQIADLLKEATEHSFHDYKLSTMARRIQRRMHMVRIANVNNYLTYLKGKPEEAKALFRDLLIGVTTFFRDADAFDFLKENVLRGLFANRTSEETIRIWVAGCSTGEEAYTLAILCREIGEQMDRPPSVQIFASDIDDGALAKARAGSYSRAIEAHVSADRRKRFFTSKGNRYEVNPEIRSLVLFSLHNLTSDPPFSRLDLISCRNLMIYLGEHSNEKIIPIFHYALNVGGYLMLGPSENISSNNELFRTIDASFRIAQRKELASGTTKGLEFRQGRLTPLVPKQHAAGDGINWNELRQQVLVEDFLPRSCIINTSGKILNASANIEKYLTLNDGDFKNDIIAMASSGLRIGLRTALKEVKATRKKVQIEDLSIRFQDKIQPVMLTVIPLTQVDEEHEVYMVVFQDVGKPFARDESEHAIVHHTPDADKIISQLETELETNRKELDKSLQDMEATNEELKSSNEELLSMNEELFAANEELETSKEEILQGRLAIEKAHSDLKNLLRSTRIGSIFLDHDHRICNFTPAISEIYELLSSDIGRPLDRFVPMAFNMPPLPNLRSVRADRPIEHTVQAKSGKSFIRRVLPYVSHDGNIEGMVVTFHDVTDLRASEAMFQSLVDASSQIVWVADAKGLVIADSPSWRAFTGQSIEQWSESKWSDAIHPDDRESSTQRWQATIQSGEVLNHEYRLWHHTGVWRWTHVRAVAQRNPDGSIHRWVGMNTDITERKRWEIDLKNRESHLRRVIDNTLCFVGVLSLDGILLEANATAIAAAGLQREDVIGKPFHECYWWNYGEESVIQQLQQAIVDAKGGKSARYDVVVRMAGDSRMTIDFMLSPVRDVDGQITHLIPSGVDISQRKLAEQTLIDQANQLNLALDSGRMGMYEWEPETDTVVWDERHLLLTGLPRTKMTGTDFLKLVHPDDVKANGIAIEKAIRGEQEYNIEFRIIRTDGQVRWLAAHGKIVKFDDGRPTRFVGLNWDITDRKQTEMTLKLNEARLRNAAAAAGFATLHADFEEGILNFSAELRRLIGLPEDALLRVETGRLPDWIHPDDILACTNHIQESIKLKEGCSISLDLRIIRIDGEVRWMRLHSKPIYTGDGERRKATQWIGTLLDITQQRKFEESLKSARQLAEAANESKSLFLANMSHEIRTPMTAILGFAELLEDNELGKDPTLSASAIQTIRTNATHLLSVINDILDMSKIEAGSMSVEEIEISPTQLLREVESLLGPRAKGKGISLKLMYDTLMPERIYSDPTRLRQILLNLVGNAIKFTETGSVEIRTSFFATTNRIQFRIVDTGIGLTAKQLEIVSTFQAFSQADASTTRRSGGTGLGLRISNTLAQLLGGFINVESQPGKGSVFTVTIEAKIPPVDKNNTQENTAMSRSQMPSSPDASFVNVSQPLKGMRILVAEDGPDNQKLISFHLRRAGAEVVIAENGLIAAEYIEKGDCHFDLILMDMQMPVLDGYQATQRLRNAGYTKPIVALTAHAMETDRLKCLEAGCDAFATKPINRQDLVALAECYRPGGT